MHEQLSANIHIQIVYRTMARRRTAWLNYWHELATVQEYYGKLSVDTDDKIASCQWTKVTQVWKLSVDTGDTRLQAVRGDG